tara:strand:+ start:588 stop:893 length:306 start_codon:yes stop_codon:yes gene_type:complete
MAKRYENTSIKTSTVTRGIGVTKAWAITSNATTVFGPIPKTDNDIYVITQMGDRLDHLANQFYGDQGLWWYIAKANNLKFMTIPTGTRLRIPGSTEYAIGK